MDNRKSVSDAQSLSQDAGQILEEAFQSYLLKSYKAMGSGDIRILLICAARVSEINVYFFTLARTYYFNNERIFSTNGSKLLKTFAIGELNTCLSKSRFLVSSNSVMTFP